MMPKKKLTEEEYLAKKCGDTTRKEIFEKLKAMDQTPEERAANRRRSEFAEALDGLLKTPDMFEMSEWAEYLFVKVNGRLQSPKRIEDWLSDKSVPPAYHLNMVYLTITGSSVDQAGAEKFKAMAEKRATLVSPHGALMLPTVWEYMKRPGFNELSSRLAKLDDKGKAELLLSLYPEGSL